MKKLEIRDKFKSLSKFGRMLALTGTISASAICFSGCGEKKEASLEKDGKILQLLRLSSRKNCAWRVGYFTLKEDNLHFVDAFERQDINLSYLLTMSDNMELSYCNYASICNTDTLLSYKINETDFEVIINNLEKNSAKSISFYSCKDEVALKNIKDSSYEDIIKNTSLEKVNRKNTKYEEIIIHTFLLFHFLAFSLLLPKSFH